MSLLGTLREVVARLDEAGIPHMVAGSVASTYYSEPRTTQDIDIVIDPTPAALSAFVQDLPKEQYYVGNALDAFDRQSQFNVIDTASGWKVDLIIRRDRPFSISEFERRRAVELEGMMIYLATAEDTILSKLEWAQLGGSERQLRDVRSMVEVLRGNLDLQYLERWAEELGMTVALSNALNVGGSAT